MFRSCSILTFVFSWVHYVMLHCFAVNNETAFVCHCNTGTHATVQMLSNTVKWDGSYWALGATGRQAARYRLGTC